MRVQRVLMPDGSESWTVLGDDGMPVPPVERFLAHLHALDRAPTTQRTYATSLKLWLVFLDRIGVALDEASVEAHLPVRGDGCVPRPRTWRFCRAARAGAARRR